MVLSILTAQCESSTILDLDGCGISKYGAESLTARLLSKVVNTGRMPLLYLTGRFTGPIHSNCRVREKLAAGKILRMDSERIFKSFSDSLDLLPQHAWWAENSW